MAGSDTVGNELGEKLWKRADKLRDYRRSVFDPRWQEISNYYWPDVSDINTEKTESTTGWFDRLYESTAIRSSATCSVGVRNWVTPSTEPWIGLSPPAGVKKRQQGQGLSNPRMARLSSPAAPTPDDNGIDEATRWCDNTASLLIQELASSNFYSCVQPFNRSACTFGTALLYMDKGKANLFRFEQFKVGTYVIAENDEKHVDTVIRWFKLTARQAAQKWCMRDADGKPLEAPDLSKLPQKIARAYENKKFDEMFEFLHHVFPNGEFKVGALGSEGMAFSSVYQAVSDKKIVEKGGYEEMPYFCLRWSRWGTEDQAYGCSPAFETLMEARQLNFVTQFQDAKVELDAFPRILYPDNLDGNIQLAAGAVTVYKHDQPEAVPKEWVTQGNNESLQEMVGRKQMAIEKAFFVDVFRALGDLGDKITQATYGAVALLQGEKLDQFTGTFDQYRTDLINPLVLRAIGIAWREGLLEDPPQALMVKPDKDPQSVPQLAAPKITVKSRVTLALDALKNSGRQKTLESLQPLIESRPEVLDNFNLDNFARNTARGNGQPESDLRSLKDMGKMRADRQKMMEQQNALHSAEIAAKAAGQLGKAPEKFQQAAGDQLDKSQAA